LQGTGQTGLEICPGRKVVTEYTLRDAWAEVDSDSGVIVYKIKDLLMSWSDNRFKGTS
jgi:isopenicillin N synthase-like dioxygenase